MILIFDIFLYKDFLKNVSNVVSTSDFLNPIRVKIQCGPPTASGIQAIVSLTNLDSSGS